MIVRYSKCLLQWQQREGLKDVMDKEKLREVYNG